MIDEYHRKFIETKLANAKFEWKELEDVVLEAGKDKDNKKKLEDVQKKYRDEISGLFKKDTLYKTIFGKEMFTEILPEEIGNNKEISIEEQKKTIEKFQKFTTYFSGFNQNRKNIYASEKISTSIAFRLVHDNFPKFLFNILVYQQIMNKAPEIINVAEQELEEFLDGKSLREIFSIDNYNNALTQKDIEKYNVVIGGYTTKESIKVKGFNEVANLYLQQNKDCGMRKKDCQMIPLFKQILSERSSLSFVIDIIEKDSQVIELINRFLQMIDEQHITDRTLNLIDSLEVSDYENVFISRQSLSDVSSEAFGRWGIISEALKEFATAERYNKTNTEKWLKRDKYSLKEINTALRGYKLEINSQDNGKIGENCERELNINSYFMAAEKKIEQFRENLNEYESNITENTIVKGEAENKRIVKELSDSIVNLVRYLKPFNANSELDGNMSFYGEYQQMLSAWDEFSFDYNKIRNYITKKEYSQEKIKLNFKNPTLAKGWDKNKENDNTTIMLIRGNQYYLGVMNTKNKPKFDVLTEETDIQDTYYKMNYKYFKNLTTMVPKCTTQKKEVVEHFNESSTDIELIDEKLFFKPLVITKEIFELNNPKGDAMKKFKIEYLRDTEDNIGYDHAVKTWISFCMEFLKSYKSTAGYDYDILGDVSQYQSIMDFYTEVNKILYKITWDKISSDAIDDFVDSGKLYLFQIYNKDFAEGATGTPNLHTLFWKAMFDEENLKDVVIKLNGEAELFYRKRSIKKEISHKVGEKKVNKRMRDGAPIPENIYREIYLYANNRVSELEGGSLSEEAKEIIDLDKVSITEVSHEIVKDRRYTMDKFLFHVPLTINFKAPMMHGLNNEVLEFLKNNKDVNIIGLDRGERHLIYLTLINQDGELLEQKSYNIINGMNYHDKLDQCEKGRDNARKAWETIDVIKNLKAGYLSQVVHEIVEMMVKHNAIVVMEDLNSGFKRGRFKVEKQVYQKFEKMLIDKLNYLVDKKANFLEPTGVLKGLQLTEAFESFQKMTKQNGFIFYIPAAYTSKIDPMTGFANVFDMTKLTNFDARKVFLSRFDKIQYDGKEDMFKFEFNLDNFNVFQTFYKKDWTVYTNSQRIKKEKKDEKYISKNVNLTESLKEVLESGKINYTTSENIAELIIDMQETKENREILTGILDIFKLALQMRNSNPATGEDYIISCVKNNEGEFFDSRNGHKDWPKDADANGAYNIALKGKMVLDKIDRDVDSKSIVKIPHSEWFEFMQKRNI